MVKKEVYLRNAKGQFTSTAKAVKEKDIAFAVPIGGSIADIKTKLEKMGKAASALPEIVEDSIIMDETKIEQMHNENDPAWKSYKHKGTIKEVYFDKNGNVIEKPFEYSYMVQKKLGLDKEEQRRLFEVFKKANEEVSKIKKIDPTLAAVFSYNLETTKERLENRLKAAEEILSGDYVANTAAQYKIDFMDNFSEHLEPEQYAKLLNAIQSITDMQFLNLIKNTNMDSLAYTLQSEINKGLYELVVSEVDFLIREIKDWKDE